MIRTVRYLVKDSLDCLVFSDAVSALLGLDKFFHCGKWQGIITENCQLEIGVCMRKSVAALFLTIILLPNCLVSLAFASSDTVSADTGNLPIYSGVIVRLRYSASASLSVPSFAISGSSSGSASIAYGSLQISVFVPAPISTWYNASLNVPIGSSVSIPIYAGVQAGVKIVASCVVSDPQQTTLSWDSDGAKSFSMQLETVFAESRQVTCRFSFAIRLSLIVPILGSIAERDVGSFTASPSLMSSVFLIGIVGILAFLILVALLIMAAVLSTRGKGRTRKKYVVSKSCPGCGSNIIEGAYFCSSCGASFVYCQSCGSIRLKTEEFCGNCGAKLLSSATEMSKRTSLEPEPLPSHEKPDRKKKTSESAPEKTEQQTPKDASKKYCIYCGEELWSGDSYCSKCGKKQMGT